MDKLKLQGRRLLLLFCLALALPSAFAAFGSTATFVNPTVAISCTSGNGYACHSIQYSVDKAAWQHAYGSDTNFSITTDGNHEIRYYAIGRACTGVKCTQVVEPIKFIWANVLSNTAPSLALNAPVGGELWSGVRQIDFNISDAQNQELHMKIAYSSGSSTESQVSDSFDNNSKIASSSNLDVNTATGQIKLGAGGGGTQATKSPGTIVNDASIGTLPWSNPGNATASDDSFASIPGFNYDDITNYLKATNFGFNIPGGATISGIMAEVERKAEIGMWNDQTVKIVKANGSFGSVNKADANAWPWPTDAYKSYGGSLDAWSESWTPSTINDANFGVALSAYYRTGDEQFTGYVDHVRITVYYSGTSGYNTTGTLTSTNIVSGQNVSGFTSLAYEASSIPSDTNIRVQFSQNGSTWYNSSGSLNGWNLLSQGSNSISLASLGWTGANFYYKAQMDSNGWATPALDSIALNYSYSQGAGSFANIIIADLNLNNDAAITALNCAGTNWLNSTRCTYDWNTLTVPDGNYFIDLNAWDTLKAQAIVSSPAKFAISNDTTPPFTSNNAPSGWQTTDVNVTLHCTDVNGSGCIETTWRIDQDFWQKKNGSLASLWWDGNWLYRNIVSFNNSGKAADANHSALVRLDENKFGFGIAKSDGSDLRFVNSDNNTVLNYFFDRYDSTAKIATIWVKIPLLLADSNSTYVYMYYGNAAASDAQAANWFP
jgi:hypothetical protein